MEATDVRMHHHHQQQQQHQTRTLLQHSRLGMDYCMTGSGSSGSRAIRERLSAAVTTRQLKRAAAATTTTTLDMRNNSPAEFQQSAIMNSGSSFSGLLSIRGSATGSSLSAVQEQPLDFSKKKKKKKQKLLNVDVDDSDHDDSDDDDGVTTNELEEDSARPWKKSQGRRSHYLHADAFMQNSDFNTTASSVRLVDDDDDACRTSPLELPKPLDGHSQFVLQQRTSTVLNDLMMSATSVQQQSSQQQKLATVRPFKNYESMQDFYNGQKLPFVSRGPEIEAEMSSPMDNERYSADSYLEFRRQILSLHQSLGKRSSDVVAEYLPHQSDLVQHHVAAYDNSRVHHHHQVHHQHQQRNGHHDHHNHFGERSSSDPSDVCGHPSRTSSNSSCSSMSPVMVAGGGGAGGVRSHHSNLHVSPEMIINGGTVGSSRIPSGLPTSGAVSSNKNRGANNSTTSSTSSVEGVVGSRRRAGRSLPDELKDDAYWERRRKNNEAAKRSRDARRAKEDEIAIRAAFLEQENLKLRVEVASLKSETTKLRCLLYNS